MKAINLNFGTLLELTEDWIRSNQDGNRILARIVDGKEVVEIPVGAAYFVEDHKTIYLVTKSRNQQDIFDDDGNLLNDETPKGIYKGLEMLENQGLDYKTPLEIEIWFTDGGDDIQYRLECHEYAISQNNLILTHFLGREKDEIEEEFRYMLHQQY